MRNNLHTALNTNNETCPGYRNPENFVVVSNAYPTVTAITAVGGSVSIDVIVLGFPFRDLKR